MGKLLNGADKEVLVDIVRFSQKQNLKGVEGGWKDYLALHDKKLGNTIGDPARKPKDFLIAFLRTFPSNLRKYFEKMIKRYNGCKMFLHFNKSANLEPPQMVIMDRLVKPTKSVKNYRTAITGISAKDLDGVTCSLTNVQKSLKQILKKGPILIGHGLFNDLQALKIDYLLVVDTASIFSYANLATRLAPSLNNLGLALPDLSSKDLLVHRVPVAVPYLELTRIFPGTPEIHDRIKVKGDLYSTFVKFKNSKEAEGAYEALNGMISQVLIDKLICPGKPVKDYRTHITGMSAEDLDGVTCTLAKIQKSLRKILKKGTILIGHSLFFDLQALKIDYPLVIDTTCIFKHADLPPGVSPSLNNLCKKDIRVSGSGNVYATLVEFRNAKEAEKAFEDLDGDLNQYMSSTYKETLNHQLMIH
ncbi:Small RNA degrading nuclease 3 [Carex littledalei]|uniref:Small RNA degrading nuclease 3 n=1 Tax=Carex littledalei TaxID=544730 RepID=A0A833VHG5_9POAL|nr:Small RNA degrading nuclease 3 [Carex littledalei]